MISQEQALLPPAEHWELLCDADGDGILVGVSPKGEELLKDLGDVLAQKVLVGEAGEHFLE
eukprot:7941307-Lingulodinium_polyedra.AAC.1